MFIIMKQKFFYLARTNWSKLLYTLLMYFHYFYAFIQVNLKRAENLKQGGYIPSDAFPGNQHKTLSQAR